MSAGSYEQVKRLTREYNIHYRACIWSLIYLLSTIVDLSFAVHKLAKFSANPGKVHFEGLLNLLRYIRENKTFGQKYYADLNDAPATDLLRKDNINTKNHLKSFSDYSWQDCPDTGRSTGAYNIFYQGGTIDHGTHVPGPVAQSSAESEYNAACTAGMAQNVIPLIRIYHLPTLWNLAHGDSDPPHSKKNSTKRVIQTRKLFKGGGVKLWSSKYPLNPALLKTKNYIAIETEGSTKVMRHESLGWWQK